MKKLTINDARLEAIKNNGECLSKDYKSSSGVLQWKCEFGHVFDSRFSDVKYNNSWCPICGGNKKHTIMDAKNEASKNNGICLSTEYKNANTKLIWKCSIGHTFSMTLAHIKNKMQWCPKCGAAAHKNTNNCWEPIGYKFCPTCHNVYQLSLFGNSKHFIDCKRYNCKHCRKIEAKKYIENNREKRNLNNRTYRKNNKQKIALYSRTKRNSDICYKLRNSLRRRLNNALKGNYRGGSAVRDLGCSIDFLKQYLENKFYINSKTNEMMSWDNYGMYGWHIDHIKPLKLFNLSDNEEVKKACNYLNLQPMWAEENITKGAKYNDDL